MRRLRYNVATSLDGFIARQDGTFDWIVEDSSIDFAGLVDTVEVAQMPVLLGAGIPMLPAGGTAPRLELTNVSSLPVSGIVMLTYAVKHEQAGGPAA